MNSGYNICVGTKYSSNSHSKYLLQFHLIFVCKYRKPLLENNEIADEIKILSKIICLKHNVEIKYVETDKDHIHYLFSTKPNCNLANIVKTLKSYTTYHIWVKFQKELSKIFWKERTFWTDGYFISSVGNVSENTIKQYIESQGK